MPSHPPRNQIDLRNRNGLAWFFNPERTSAERHQAFGRFMNEALAPDLGQFIARWKGEDASWQWVEVAWKRLRRIRFTARSLLPIVRDSPPGNSYREEAAETMMKKLWTKLSLEELAAIAEHSSRHYYEAAAAIINHPGEEKLRFELLRKLGPLLRERDSHLAEQVRDTVRHLRRGLERREDQAITASAGEAPRPARRERLL
ncbi:MAG: hypothetical protein HYV42_02445 [Candidatus Magasanikbacteria bacterium]|nr:hypothetical protein [Candidatus Magasanikbacteria bacterium]